MSKVSNQLGFDPSIVIRRPLVTEKSSVVTGAVRPVYTFVVTESANKMSVGKAVEALYKVKPVKVNVVNVPGKKVFNRGRLGRSAGFKKALVYLRPGDKIELA